MGLEPVMIEKNLDEILYKEQTIVFTCGKHQETGADITWITS